MADVGSIPGCVRGGSYCNVCLCVYICLCVGVLRWHNGTGRVRWGGQRLVGTLWSHVLLAYCAVCECEG